MWLGYGVGARALFQADGALGASVAGSRFGTSLASGPLNATWHIDLAVGAPGQTTNGQSSAGAVELALNGPLFLDGFESGTLLGWDEQSGG